MRRPDDWYKPRSHGMKLTDEDIQKLFAAYRAGKSSRDAAREIACSSRVATKYFSTFRCDSPIHKLPVKPIQWPKIPPRFYKGSFEL